MNGINVTFPLDGHCFRATVIREKNDPRTGVREDTRRGSLCLQAIIQAGFKQPPKAELSPDLSRDRSMITARWINTRVVKVKWCYVACCYWTRPVKIHDTDTFSRPPLDPAAGWKPCCDPKKRSCVEAFAHSRWSVSAHGEPCWLQQLSIISDTIKKTIWHQKGVSRPSQNHVTATVYHLFLTSQHANFTQVTDELFSAMHHARAR